MGRNNSSIVILFSGGFDSYTLVNYMIQKEGFNNVLLLNIHYGQVNEVEEIVAKWLYYHLRDKKYPDVNFDFMKLVIPREFTDQLFYKSALYNKDIQLDQIEKNKQPNTYVPFRNLLFLTIASVIAENNNINNIAIAIQPHSHYYYWDTTENFVNKLNELFNLNKEHPIKIHAPFVNLSKKEIYKLGKYELGITDEEYRKTWSCYRPIIEFDKNVKIYKPCNKCGSCIERVENGIPQSDFVAILS